MADKDIKTGIEKRFGIIYICAILFALCIVGRIVWLNVWQHDKWIARINESQKEVAIEPNRGDICACDGVQILATSIPYYDVRFDTKAVNSDVFRENHCRCACRDFSKTRAPTNTKHRFWQHATAATAIISFIVAPTMCSSKS